MLKSRLGLLTVLAVVVAVTVAVASGVLPGPRDLPRTDGPITDPIPEKPIVSGLALTLQEFVTMPRSDSPSIDDPRVKRWARINFLGEVPDRSGRLFVPDLNGKMYLIENGMPREYLDVGAEFAPDFWSESSFGSGFGFATFHPDFAKNGRFYGDDDYWLLYLAVGDGGNGADADDPQKLGIPQGKVLRIDPQGTNGAGGQYGIPPTNPFVGKPGALAEIYAYGLRDPHRFSWDPSVRNRMLVGNMGEHAIESIYEVRAGDNLGWGEREGPFVFKREDRCHVYPLPADDEQHGYTYPVLAYDHDPPPGWPCDRDSGHAVIGGFVYRGEGTPDLRGKYVFGDGVDGRIFYATRPRCAEAPSMWPRSTSSCSSTTRAGR